MPQDLNDELLVLLHVMGGGGGGGGAHLLCGPYWGCAAPKGHFLSPDSLAKGVFLANIPQPRVYFSPEVLSRGYIFLRIPLKNGILGLN